MTGYRKIKIFNLSDFENIETCQEAVNDYWAELNRKDIESDININTSFITVVIKNQNVAKEDRNFKVSGEDLLVVLNRNTKIDTDKVIKSDPIGVNQYGKVTNCKNENV